ncbi:uncharacterized protein LOC126836115 isoform X2 [Adelges cooleyi]|uniref:uncharacterized protein LOC126836115 isoform X2 n=1 Tax=Adelges cooleyi TaxID=133065 RepID=UPI0021800114|nr:uncharacterized protein LOC126836115 isoform X2 [Adelges cooleyi]
MNRLCFFILFVIVNVSTEFIEYKRKLVITNALIKRAYDMNDCFVQDKYISNGLEHVIRTIASKDGYTLDVINRMFVLPEIPKLEDIEKSKNLEYAMQKKITIELAFDKNLILGTVPIMMICYLIYIFKEIAAHEHPEKDFTALTIMQLGEQRRNLIGKALRNILSQAIGDKIKIPSVGERGDCKSLEKRKVLGTPSVHDAFSTLSINDTSAKDKNKSEESDDGNEDFELIDYYERQDNETSVPPSIERLKIIENYVDKDCAQQSSKCKRNTHHVPLMEMCTCLALFSSTKFPTGYLTVLPFDYDDTCLITNKKSVPQTFMYRKIAGVWYKVTRNTDNPAQQPLKEPLDQELLDDSSKMT